MEENNDEKELEQKSKGGGTMNNYFQGATIHNLTINNGTMTQSVLPSTQLNQPCCVKNEWVNTTEEQKTDEGEDGVLNVARQSKLDEIIGILQKGNWKQPATAENVEMLLNTIFGRDILSLDEGDEPLCEKMWEYAEKGGGDRMLIVPANLAGFFKEENLLIGSPKDISTDLFGINLNQSNNINKGNPQHCSNAFSDVTPFLRKYINKIIRKE